ncbi:MAG: GAF domain-containing protein [Burkholderiaceae bacterium]|nr:GAF domain-containing protein [Burkholderiaceae bacterium]
MNKMGSVALGMQQGMGADDDVRRLYFFKKLQAVANKIHATDRINEIILDLSPDICDLFGCERLTIYSVGEGRTTIETMIKTGLNSFKDFSLPISDRSVAGYVALSKKMVNVVDVYDEAEMAKFNPSFQFLKKVDKRTGFRTREMLVAPIVHERTRELLGVLQIINNRAGGAFTSIMEEGAVELCNTLAVAFAQRLQTPAVRSKYHPLVASGVIAMAELELAGQEARLHNRSLEEVLHAQFQVKTGEIGAALAAHFGMPYEPFRAARQLPPDVARNFKREFVEHNQWLVLEKGEAELVVLATDPERVRNSRMIFNLFPKSAIRYLVTTETEFAQTVEQVFGEASPDLESGFGNTLPRDPEAGAEEDLLRRVKQTILNAFGQSAADIQIEIVPGKENTVTNYRRDGSAASVSGQIAVNFHFDFPRQDGQEPPTGGLKAKA